MMSDILVLPHEIGAGPDREVQILLADRWRKLVLIQLRHGALLADHTARFPSRFKPWRAKAFCASRARPMCSAQGSSFQSMRTLCTTSRATLTWPSWCRSFVRPKRTMNTTTPPKFE
jgi:hypothetical protein